MNNKTIIEFGFRIIWRIMDDGIMAQEIIPICYPSDIDKLEILISCPPFDSNFCLPFDLLMPCPMILLRNATVR